MTVMWKGNGARRLINGVAAAAQHRRLAEGTLPSGKTGPLAKNNFPVGSIKRLLLCALILQFKLGSAVSFQLKLDGNGPAN